MNGTKAIAGFVNKLPGSSKFNLASIVSHSNGKGLVMMPFRKHGVTLHCQNGLKLNIPNLSDTEKVANVVNFIA